MCLESGLLMQLKVMLTKGRKAAETGFSGAEATVSGALTARRICQSLQSFCLKKALRCNLGLVFLPGEEASACLL
jgi:hypothetical protein